MIFILVSCGCSHKLPTNLGASNNRNLLSPSSEGQVSAVGKCSPLHPKALEENPNLLLLVPKGLRHFLAMAA